MTAVAKNNPFEGLLERIGSVLHLTTASVTLSDDAAHEARKELKKARAALRLVRSTIGDAAYRREDAVLRNASRTISPLRDAKAQIDILALLNEREGDAEFAHRLRPLQAKLLRNLKRARANVRPATPEVARCIKALSKSRRRLALLATMDTPSNDVRLGLRKIYRQGRAGFETAKARKTSASLHAWRKKAKYLYNAVNLLGKRAGSDLRHRATMAKKLGKWLGEEHDLAVLALGASPARNRTERRLRSVIDDRCRKLRKKAIELGAETFATRPRKVVS